MSRHRSPGGLPRVPARHRGTTQSAVRNTMTAAAAAGGVLAVVVPATTLATGPATADAAVLQLAADDQPLIAAGGVRLVASVLPVADLDEPGPVDVSELVKAAGLEDAARQAEQERAARESAAVCDVDLDDLGRVKPYVRDAARFLSCLYERPDLIGVANRSRHSDHPSGRAVDLMVRGEQADRIADCALANQDELGVSYVIWAQRINYGDGWERMSDRGGDTANHYDHVHISFERGGGDGNPSAALCS